MNRRLQLDAEFDRFLSENPVVYSRFRMICVKLKAQGHTKWGAKSVWEVLRWQLAIETNASVKGPRLNNNYTSRMARKLMVDEPDEFGSFFELRRLAGGEDHPDFTNR